MTQYFQSSTKMWKKLNRNTFRRVTFCRADNYLLSCLNKIIQFLQYFLQKKSKNTLLGILNVVFICIAENLCFCTPYVALVYVNFDSMSAYHTMASIKGTFLMKIYTLMKYKVATVLLVKEYKFLKEIFCLDEEIDHEPEERPLETKYRDRYVNKLITKLMAFFIETC